ncbi:hypothetical protein TNCV_4188281, partial [Trichonephila clavipes]
MVMVMNSCPVFEPCTTKSLVEEEPMHVKMSRSKVLIRWCDVEGRGVQ